MILCLCEMFLIKSRKNALLKSYKYYIHILRLYIRDFVAQRWHVINLIQSHWKLFFHVSLTNNFDFQVENRDITDKPFDDSFCLDRGTHYRGNPWVIFLFANPTKWNALRNDTSEPMTSTRFQCKKSTQQFFFNSVTCSEKEYQNPSVNEINSKGNLSIHIQVKHKERQFKWHFARFGNVFIRKEMLEDHLNGHCDINLIGCSVCSKIFHSRYKRNDHQAVCTGRITFQCTTCNVTFTSKPLGICAWYLGRHTSIGVIKHQKSNH